jgi:hypothetical protein
MKTFKQFVEMVGKKKINTDVPSTDKSANEIIGDIEKIKKVTNPIKKKL